MDTTTRGMHAPVVDCFGELGELGLDLPVEGTRSLAGVFGVVGIFGVAGVGLDFTGDAVERILL